MKILLFFLVNVALAQTIGPIPEDPGNFHGLSIFADEADLTYCQATPIHGSRPIVTLTCRRSGITVFTASAINNTVLLNIGDLCWLFELIDPSTMRFSVSTNVKDPTGIFIFSSSPTDKEFIVGEIVGTNALNSGNVVSWNHTSMTSYNNGTSRSFNSGTLVLSNKSGIFPKDSTLTGQTSGATLIIDGTSNITNNKIKSRGLIVWSATSLSFFQRLFGRN